MLLIIILTLYAGASAQDASVADREKELQQVEKEIERLETLLRRVSEEKKSTVTLLEEIKTRQRLFAAEYQRLSIEIESLQKEIDALEATIQKSQQRIDDLSEKVAALLRNLYKRGNINYVRMLLTMESLDSVSAAQAYLSHIARDEAELIIDFKQQLQVRKNAVEELSIKQETLRNQQQEAQSALEQAQMKQQELQGYLEEIDKQTGIYSASLADKRRARQELRDLIARLSRQQSSVVAGSFSSLKGSLIWPVQGKVITGFGTVRDQVYAVSLESDGIEIQADQGTPVRAVAEGQVIYSDWNDMGGNMVVIDHGNRYYTIYAHLSRIIAASGKRVTAGDVIGEVGDTASLKGSMLKFEIRHVTRASEPQPLDPLEWLARR